MNINALDRFLPMNRSIRPFADQALPSATLANAREVPLGQSDVSQDIPLHTFVGASVTVCLFDRQTSWCGLRQVMFPSEAHGHRQDSMLMADAALEDIFTRMCAAAGINTSDTGQRRIQAKIFGGADMKATGLSFSDGALTSSFVRSWLNTRQISIAAECLGGVLRREIVLLPGRGVVYCRSLQIDSDFLCEERSMLSNAGKPANRIELF